MRRNSHDAALVLGGVNRSAVTLLFAAMALVGAIAAAYARDRGGVRAFTVRDARADWTPDGYLELVPAIRPPSRTRGRDAVRVWLKLPDGARLTTRRITENGRDAIVVPPGAIAARMELVDGKVADVRGTRFEDGSERFFVLRPQREGLVGVEWRRGDAVAQRDATAALVALVRSAADAPADRAAAHVERQNDCASCHVHGRAASSVEGEHGLVARPTDASGLFTIERVLADDAPLERYAAFDPNLADPFVDVTCGDAPVRFEGEGDARRARCDGGRVPVARLDVRAALAAGDPHARALCASRRALYERLDERARAIFGAAVAACGVGVPR